MGLKGILVLLYAFVPVIVFVHQALEESKSRNCLGSLEDLGFAVSTFV